MKNIIIGITLLLSMSTFASKKKYKTCRAKATATDHSSYSSAGASSECRSEAKSKAKEKCSRLDRIESVDTSVTSKKYVTWGGGYYKVKCSAVVRGYYYK